MELASNLLLGVQVMGLVLVMASGLIAFYGLLSVALNMVICTRWSRNSTAPEWRHPRAAYLQTFVMTTMLAVAGMLFWKCPGLITGSKEWGLLKVGEVWSAVVLPFSPMPWGVLGLAVGVVALRLAWRAGRGGRRSTATPVVPPQPTGAVSV